MSGQPAREPAQRRIDTLERLERDVDTWVASADREGNFRLIPLSFWWDGSALTVATPGASPVARAMRASGLAQLGVGPTRDVVLIDGTVEVFRADKVPGEVADAFAAKLWDARADGYDFFRITPQRIRAWREENELPGRTLMRNGRWLT